MDRGYTGRLHNDGVGLIYMNARYYVPSLGRFASADTLVPDPTNPQQFNRFSYTLNNPIRFTDPTGHCVFELPCLDDAILGLEFVISTLAKSVAKVMANDLGDALLDVYTGGSGQTRTLNEHGMRLTEANISFNFIGIDDNGSLVRNDALFDAIDRLENSGETEMEINLLGLGLSQANISLGNFTVNFKGTLGINDTGEWYLDGEMTFSDGWDFDRSTHRTGATELKTFLAGAALLGRPFEIRSVSLPVYQGEKDTYAQWE
ncbi:MAG: lipid II-degrading bacteriocin [Chloroflexi bacterium]|nr:lipid II-degrading bacteriocin [Chloroflexota bacterium]